MAGITTCWRIIIAQRLEGDGLIFGRGQIKHGSLFPDLALPVSRGSPTMYLVPGPNYRGEGRIFAALSG